MTQYQFEQINKWQDETFGRATALSKIAHLKQEVDELECELKQSNNPTNTLEEFADCFILLFGCAASYGMTYEDCCEAINKKMEINRNRKWGNPDKNGVVNHIKK